MNRQIKALGRYNLKKIVSTYRFFYKFLPILLLIDILFLISCIIGFGYSIQKDFHDLLPFFSDLYNTILYVRMRIIFNVVEILVGFISVSAVLLWMFLSYFGFQLIQFIVDAIYLLFDTSDLHFLAKSSKYYFVLKKSIGNSLNYVVVFVLLIALYIMGKAIINSQPLPHIINIFVYLVIFAIPMCYFVTWSNFFFIRGSRKSKHAREAFDIYLFSKSAIQARSKNIVGGLFFFAFLGWFLIPAYFAACEWFTKISAEFLRNFVEYDQKWNVLLSSGKINIDKFQDIFKIPSPENIEIKLSWLSKLGTLETLTVHLPQFMNGMFIIITLITVSEIGIPSILNAFLFKERRGFLKFFFLATLKSSIIVFGLQLIISKAYFYDFSNVSSISSLFFFCISFFLMQQTESWDKIQKAKTYK